MSDTTHSIRLSASRFFSGTLLSRVAGMLRDMSMAYAFGTQPAIAAFMLAFRLAHLFRRLFGEGALQSAFIPEFETLRLQDSQRAFSFFRDLAAGLSLFLVGLITFLCLGLGATLAWGDLSVGNHEVVFLTLLMLPSLLFICLFGLNAALLQCEKSYFTPSVAPVAFNIVWIMVVLALTNIDISTAVPLLAVGVIIACLFQWLLTVPKTYQILKSHLNGSLWKNIRLRSPDLTSLIKPLFLGILGVAATQMNVAVDSLFARFADPEGPAILWYAIRLEQLPLALFGIALSGALLPPLSRALKAVDWTQYYKFLHFALTSSCALMIPLTAAIFVMGDTSVNLIYGHGDFSIHAVIATTGCLWAYGIGLLPSTLVLILAPACYADRNYRLPAIASLMTMLLNGVLNGLFIIYFGWGAISVALATSLSAWVNLFYLGFSLSKKGPLLSSQMLSQIAKILFITAAASFVTVFFRNTVQELPLLDFLTGNIIEQISTLALQMLIFFGICGGGYYLTNLSKWLNPKMSS